MANALAKIQEDLEFLKKEVTEIKYYIEDYSLSKEEELLLKKARKEHAAGKTISLQDLKKEL